MENKAWIGLIPLLLLAACSGSEPYQDIQAYFKQVDDQQTLYTDQLHKHDIKLPEAVVYSGNLRRSPFEATAIVTETSKATATNPLQAYSITVLRLLGTVTENGSTVAYVTAPDNMVYHVQVGDMIGDHHGKIVSIQPGSVNVMELDADNPKEKMQRIVTLRLRNDT